MNFRKALRLQKIFTCIAVVLLSVGLLLYFDSFLAKVVLSITALALFLAGFILSQLFVRCPKCGKKLHTKLLSLPDKCSRCGCDIDLAD